jgi:hypothetical protein
MHPEALTGQRDARSVYNFGRILTDRIDSQSARNINGGPWARRFAFPSVPTLLGSASGVRFGTFPPLGRGSYFDRGSNADVTM